MALPIYIKSGSYPNLINCKSKGVVPVTDRLFHFDKQEVCSVVPGNGEFTLWLYGNIYDPIDWFWTSDEVVVRGK